MSSRKLLRFVVLVLAIVFLAVLAIPAQQVSPALYQGMRWRLIGPFRGGRTVAISGIPGNSNVFYMAANNGGVWKTTDAGWTWIPIFDDQGTGSIGALAVAPSNPEVIYVGSGEGLRRPDLSVGDGMYKSADGGQSWQHLGLRDAQQISAILVDPKDPNRVFVAALGHPYGPNAERGVFRSLDGGATWEKVLSKDENTGAVDLAFDPRNAQTIYGVMWASRRPPVDNRRLLRCRGKRALQIRGRRKDLAPVDEGPSLRDGPGPHRSGDCPQRSEPDVCARAVEQGGWRLSLRRRG